MRLWRVLYCTRSLSRKFRASDGEEYRWVYRGVEGHEWTVSVFQTIFCSHFLLHRRVSLPRNYFPLRRDGSLPHDHLWVVRIMSTSASTRSSYEVRIPAILSATYAEYGYYAAAVARSGPSPVYAYTHILPLAFHHSPSRTPQLPCRPSLITRPSAFMPFNASMLNPAH